MASPEDFGDLQLLRPKTRQKKERVRWQGQQSCQKTSKFQQTLEEKRKMQWRKERTGTKVYQKPTELQENWLFLSSMEKKKPP